MIQVDGRKASQFVEGELEVKKISAEPASESGGEHTRLLVRERLEPMLCLVW